VEAVKIQAFRDVRLVLLHECFKEMWCQQNVGNHSSSNAMSHLADGHINTVRTSHLAEHFFMSLSIPQFSWEMKKFLASSYIFTFNFT
jgi:hypothetical protein